MKIKWKIVITSVCAIVFLYGIKCYMGIDIFRSRSLGVYRSAKFNPPLSPTVAFAQPSKLTLDQNRVTVDVLTPVAAVNSKIYGHNFLGYDPSQNYQGMKFTNKNTDYGAGLWDGKWDMAPVESAVNLAKSIGMSIVRFPGGCGTHHYDWKKAVGKERKEFLFGIDEFLETSEKLGAETVFTISYFTGDEHDAADLVEYLNSPADGTNPNGGIDWAEERAKNGHPRPYDIKYFEIGNEVWHGDHQDIDHVAPEAYAKRYLKYYAALKAVDPDIQIGVLLYDDNWTRKVLEIVKDRFDLGVVHFYFSGGWAQKDLAMGDPKDIFAATLKEPPQYEVKIFEKLKIMRESAGKNMPIAFTEYNGSFVQEKPVPYRHTMGNALVNAELIRVFMKPENNILMANHWNFINEYWGMVANGFQGKYEDLNNPYYKRPNYYVFEMYHKHFGDVLVDVRVAGDGYDLSNSLMFKNELAKRSFAGKVEGKNLLPEQWQVSDFSGASAGVSHDVLGIDFVAPKQFNYYHTHKVAVVDPDTFYKLSGHIKTDELVDKDKNGVCLEVQDGRGWTKTHSAISTQKIKGTTGWQYVEAIYKTLPDADTVKVIARRIGETGPLKGKAYFKDVKLEKFIPDVETKIPYLSVNASKSEDGSKVYLMVVNKNLDSEMTATIELKDFVPAATGNAWVLNGPAVDATNEKDHNNVKVTHKEFVVWSEESGVKNRFEFTFEPHSLTAIEVGVGGKAFSKRFEVINVVYGGRQI